MSDSPQTGSDYSGDDRNPLEYKVMDDVGYPRGFLYLLNEAIGGAKELDEQGALLVLSIDNLAMIMSGYGHETAEQVLCEVQDEISQIIGANDSIQRIQRDQFGMILNNIDASEITYLSERILSAVQHYSCYSDYGSLHVICSIASVPFPEKAEHAQEALNKTFLALSDPSRGNIRSFERASEQSASDRQEMGLANYLSKAIKEERLMMAYQPVISSTTGEIAHYEALLRLRSPEGQVSSGGPLIPIAERMGLIDVIDQLVMEMVLKELRYDEKVRLAFNVSNLTTFDTLWLEKLTKEIEYTPEIAPRIIVEITETAAQCDLRKAAYFVAAIQALGCKVALDDFGSGYTSFRQLKTLSVDMVKIDGAFIKDLVDNADNRFFVKTLLDFTQGFGLTSVAEFVETGEVAKMLMELGVDLLQGYYFGKPETHRAWLSEGEYKAD